MRRGLISWSRTELPENVLDGVDGGKDQVPEVVAAIAENPTDVVTHVSAQIDGLNFNGARTTIKLVRPGIAPVGRS